MNNDTTTFEYSDGVIVSVTSYGIQTEVTAWDKKGSYLVEPKTLTNNLDLIRAFVRKQLGREI